MGFSTIAAFSIILVAFIASVSIVYSAVDAGFEKVKEVMEERKESFVEKQNTEITVNNTSISGNATEYMLIISIKNDGSITLDVNDFTVLVDGTPRNFVFSPDGLLYPENSVMIYVSGLSGSGSHRFKVVTGNGIEIYGSYVV
jgi:archaellum component FlaF (FlaF/FlaG flagellin family)